MVLDINLVGLIFDPDSDPTDTRVTLEVVLYESDPFAFFRDRGTLDFEVGATPLIQRDAAMTEASVQLQLDFDNYDSDLERNFASGTISIDVMTGDEFYIYALLESHAQSGITNDSVASADAFNTGTMTFRGSPDLVAASVVPVPAAIWLFGSGLIGLIGLAKRKKA